MKKPSAKNKIMRAAPAPALVLALLLFGIAPRTVVNGGQACGFTSTLLSAVSVADAAGRSSQTGQGGLVPAAREGLTITETRTGGAGETPPFALSYITEYARRRALRVSELSDRSGDIPPAGALAVVFQRKSDGML